MIKISEEERAAIVSVMQDKFEQFKVNNSWGLTDEMEDNCQEAYVSKEQLEELKSLCEKIINSTKLVPGKVHNGTSYKGNEVIEHWEDGMVLEDSTMAEEFLPTQDGFFFGGTHYDEYYWQDLLDTIEICKRALEVYDSHSSIYYKSSW